MTTRRLFLTGLASAAIAAPAIVRASSIMPIKVWHEPFGGIRQWWLPRDGIALWTIPHPLGAFLLPVPDDAELELNPDSLEERGFELGDVRVRLNLRLLPGSWYFSTARA